MRWFISIFVYFVILRCGLVPCFADSVETKRVMFFSRYTGDYWQIWKKDFDSSVEKQVTFTPTDKRMPQCIFNENKIIYKNANAQMMTYDLKTQVEQRILADYEEIIDFNISLDGQKIVFSRERKDLPDTSDIWMSDLDGKKATMLTDMVGTQLNPVFSPDQMQVAFMSQNLEHDGFDLKILDLKTGNIRNRIYNGKFHFEPTYSPDGEFLVFSGNDYEDYDIWKYSTRTTYGFQLTDSRGLDRSPVFSRDGQKVYFTSVREGKKQIWMLNADGSELQALTQGPLDSDPIECTQQFSKTVK